MNHDITQQSIYVPTAEENEAFEHGYAAGKLAGEREEREHCVRIVNEHFQSGSLDEDAQIIVDKIRSLK